MLVSALQGKTAMRHKASLMLLYIRDSFRDVAVEVKNSVDYSGLILVGICSERFICVGFCRVSRFGYMSFMRM
jgi:hypothetical protein